MAGKLLLILMSSAFLLSGCGGGEGTSTARVDTADPLDVATAFYDAVDRQDVEAALEHVLPEQAEDFRNAMSGGMPDMPDDYEVIVMAQGEEAEASITGSDLEVDMVLVDGRWWITR